MYERWLEALRPRVVGERALSAVRAIAAHHRIQASPGYDAAARWLGAELAALPVRVESEEVVADGRTRLLGCPMPEGWDCEGATATLIAAGERRLLCDYSQAPLSLVQRSSPAHGEHRLIVVRDGSRPEDYAGLEVRGCIVLTDGPIQRVHEQAVVARGAAGLLSDGRRLVPPVRTAAMDRDSLAYTSFWWQGDQPRGWGFVVSPAVGEGLRSRLAKGEALALAVDVRARRFATRIALVTATLPGTRAGEVLLTSHLCHPRPGANDNASGAAATLEAARALAALADAGELPEPRRTIRFLWMPEFTGTYAWLGGDAARSSATIAALNLDMVGEDQAACGSVQLIEQAPHFLGSFADELFGQIRAAACDPARAQPRMEAVRYSGGSDHAVWLDPAIGVPCPMLIQWPDRFYHSSLDTPERCDPGSLAHAALSAATYAAALACAESQAAAWLLDAVTRGGRRRLLQALERPEPRLAVRAERVRAQLALASIERLAYGDGADSAIRRAIARGLPDAIDALEGYHDHEVAPALRREPPLPALAGGLRRPLRVHRALLLPMRGWQPGWDALAPEDRLALHELERALAGGSTVIDLAWFACDGERTLAEITQLVQAEGWPVSLEQVEALFMLWSRLGASALA